QHRLDPGLRPNNLFLHVTVDKQPPRYHPFLGGQQVYRNVTLLATTFGSCPFATNLDETYYFPGCGTPPCPMAGMTYFPIFGYHTNLVKAIDVFGVSNAYAYVTSLATYLNDFTSLAMTYPLNTYQHLNPSLYTQVAA